ncbi:hypothetical protein Vafri_8486, partial [Volvox africanus]
AAPEPAREHVRPATSPAPGAVTAARRLLCALVRCRCGIAIGEEGAGAMPTTTPSKAGRCPGLFALDEVLPLRTSAPLAGEPIYIVAIMPLLVEFVVPAAAPPPTPLLAAPKGNGKNKSALLAKPLLCR